MRAQCADRKRASYVGLKSSDALPIFELHEQFEAKGAVVRIDLYGAVPALGLTGSGSQSGAAPYEPVGGRRPGPCFESACSGSQTDGAGLLALARGTPPGARAGFARSSRGGPLSSQRGTSCSSHVHPHDGEACRVSNSGQPTGDPQRYGQAMFEIVGQTHQSNLVGCVKLIFKKI